MWMVVRRESRFAGDVDDLVQRSAKPFEVVTVATSCALGAAANHQMLRLQFGRSRGRSLDARQFLNENVAEDEVGARIGGDEGDARLAHRAAKHIVASLIVEQVAVEQLDACIPRLADLPD